MADHGHSRGIHPRDELGARVAEDFDHGAPGTGQSRDEEPMSPGPGQPEFVEALIEMANQLVMDRAIIPDLGDREDNLGRGGGHGAIVHGRGPSPSSPAP
jgi:hypothetical protein